MIRTPGIHHLIVSNITQDITSAKSQIDVRGTLTNLPQSSESVIVYNIKIIFRTNFIQIRTRYVCVSAILYAVMCIEIAQDNGLHVTKLTKKLTPWSQPDNSIIMRTSINYHNDKRFVTFVYSYSYPPSILLGK